MTHYLRNVTDCGSGEYDVLVSACPAGRILRPMPPPAEVSLMLTVTTSRMKSCSSYLSWSSSARQMVPFPLSRKGSQELKHVTNVEPFTSGAGKDLNKIYKPAFL